MDTLGNTYATGYSWNAVNSDYITVKYNNAGVQQWAVTYNGASSTDGAIAICLDPVGNVCVTGYSYSSMANYDYATVKYNTGGVQQWVSRYNSSANLNDRPNAIAVTDSGNIFVTGYSVGSSSQYDYATVKYNSSGIQQWAVRYNGADNRDDLAYAVALDDSDNVYVTGSSYRIGYSSDFLTVKYSNGGIQQWESRYSGSSSDGAYTIKTDDSSNVYVGGVSYNSGTSFDYMVIKYDRNGTEQWISQYDSPAHEEDGMYAMAIDGNGNVTVTGYRTNSSSSYDYATVQFSRNGAELWSDIYSGPGLANDQASGVAVDKDGNVYVTGPSESSLSGYDYATVKYNSSGEVQWVERYNGPGNYDDESSGIAVDDSGNVYVTGSSNDTGNDYATIKYNTDGVIQWIARYDGSDNSDDRANAITVDNEGNVYVTGNSFAYVTQEDFTTIKYNRDGVQQWVAYYDGPANSSDISSKILLDDSGNVYVTGWSYGTSTYADYATVKYNNDGIEQWAARYDGPGHLMDSPVAIAIDDSGNVCVTGFTYSVGSANNYATVKYNAAGVEQWSALYNGLANGEDIAQSLGIDGNGNIYVTGYSRGATVNFNYATLKYDRGGTLQWTRILNGTDNSDDMATALIVDNSNNIFVAGESYSTGASYDYLIIKYNAAGDSQWIASCGSPGDVSDEPSAMTIDATGNIYLTGSASGYGWYLFFTVKYLAEPVAVREKENIIPSNYSLEQNYPNPFNPTTTITFDIPTASHVSLTVYNLLGQEIAVLVNEKYDCGRYEIEWSADDYPTGVYIYRFNAEAEGKSVSFMKKLVLVK